MFITGVDTFIGGHLALCAIYNGFKVRGTVQNTNDLIVNNQLKNAFGEKFVELQLELYQDRMDNEERTQNLASGCKYIVHAKQIWKKPSGPRD